MFIALRQRLSKKADFASPSISVHADRPTLSIRDFFKLTWQIICLYICHEEREKICVFCAKHQRRDLFCVSFWFSANYMQRLIWGSGKLVAAAWLARHVKTRESSVSEKRGAHTLKMQATNNTLFLATYNCSSTLTVMIVIIISGGTHAGKHISWLFFLH